MFVGIFIEINILIYIGERLTNIWYPFEYACILDEKNPNVISPIQGLCDVYEVPAGISDVFGEDMSEWIKNNQEFDNIYIPQDIYPRIKFGSPINFGLLTPQAAKHILVILYTTALHVTVNDKFRNLPQTTENIKFVNWVNKLYNSAIHLRKLYFQQEHHILNPRQYKIYQYGRTHESNYKNRIDTINTQKNNALQLYNKLRKKLDTIIASKNNASAPVTSKSNAATTQSDAKQKRGNTQSGGKQKRGNAQNDSIKINVKKTSKQ